MYVNGYAHRYTYANACGYSYETRKEKKYVESPDPNNTWMPWLVPKRVPVDVPIGKRNPWVPWLLQYFLLVLYIYYVTYLRLHWEKQVEQKILVMHPHPNASV